MLIQTWTSIFFTGLDLNRKESLFSTAVLIGMLKQRNDVVGNFINAPTLAKENGYEVLCSVLDYWN